MKLLSVLLLALSFNVYSQSAEQTRDRLAIDALAKTAHLLSMLDLRCSETSDCMVLPMGTKACGGPTSYLVTSRMHRFLDEIEELSSKVTDKEKEYNDRYRVGSDCSIMSPPAVVCRNKICSR